MAGVTSPADDSVIEGLRDLIQNQCVKSVAENKTKWFEETMKTVKVRKEEELTVDRFNSSSITKMTLAKWLESARDIMTRQSDIISRMQKSIEMQNVDSLEDKAAIIKLQSELIESKDSQLRSLQSAVQKTVQATVQQEVKSYSAAVVANTAPAISPDSLKNALKSAIAEGDRTKNIMIFGLSEEDGEQLESKVDKVFQELGEKPKVTVSRVGRCTGAEKSRPVKVVFTNSNSVYQILVKSGKLKRVPQFEKVYIRPDMSAGEREVRKGLVTDLKQAIKDQPNRYHYIRGGSLCSKEKTDVRT